MSRDPNSFNRHKSRLKPQPKVLIVCEDSKSGLKYLRDASKHFRVEVDVEISHCGRTDPKGIVEHGLSRESQFDRVYCVIDRDTHPSFDEAIQLASASRKIVVITSYPCYEFWLLLHFVYSRKPYNAAGGKSPAACLIDDLRKQPGMENYDKGINLNIFELLLKDRFDSARQNAQKILTAANAEGSPNPSTKLHLLIADLETLSTPQPNH